MNRQGILAGGNWIIDQIKIIDCFPGEEALANILEQEKNNGGSPYNLLKDLSLLEAPFPLEGVGLVGNDDNGRLILDDCDSHKINRDQIQSIDFAHTSFTDVMSVKDSGRRTFFHQRGANAFLQKSHFRLESSRAKIFHLGYMLLLDQLDQLDEAGRTPASYLFEEASKAGFITSSDVVSESSGRFRQVVLPSLPYLDYLFLNDLEAENITGHEIRRLGQLNMEAVKNAAAELKGSGVRKAVIIHFPEGALAMADEKLIYTQGSVLINTDLIKGSAGAGDAFAAGVLYGLHEELDLPTSLQAGVAAAAASLRMPSCSAGVESLKTCMQLAEKSGFRKLTF